jgi:DNA-binding MarR family transcriptional regulator
VRLYTLTEQGRKLARSVRSPNTPAWRIIHWLDKRDQAADEQIAEFTGVDRGTTSATLRHLKARGFVREIGREELSEL